MSPSFDLQLGRESFAPGDAVTGTVLVTEGGDSRALEIALRFHEKSPDYEEVPLNRAQALHTGPLETGHSFDFSLELPPDALPGYKSAHGELYWELDVKSDEAGRDTHERRRIEVVAAAEPTTEPDLFGGDFGGAES